MKGNMNAIPTKWSSTLGRYRVYTNAVALMLSAAGSGILGIIYWYFAAHLTSQTSVGRSAAEIAAVTLLATLSQMSFGSVFQRYLPGAGDKARGLVSRAYAICTGLALIIAISYLSLGLAKRFFSPSPRWDAIFVVTVILYTIFALQDSVLISLRVSRWVAVENNLFGVAKLLLLLPFAAYAEGQGIVISWTIPLIATVAVVNWYIFRRRLPDHLQTTTIVQPLPTFAKMLSLAIPQYATSILSMFSTSVVTLIVIAQKGAVENAHYFLVAQIAVVPAIFLWNVSKLFIVEAAHEPEELGRLTRQAVNAMSALVLLSMVVGIVFAHPLLSVFGETYANRGTVLLRMLIIALPGAAVAALYAAFAWIDGRVWFLVIREGITMIIYLAFILILIGHFGINAVGYAAVITSGAEFLLFLPLTIRRIRQIPSARFAKDSP